MCRADVCGYLSISRGLTYFSTTGFKMVILRAAFLVLTGAAGAAALKTYKDKD